MKAKIFSLLFILPVLIIDAQTKNNNFNLYFGYAPGTFIGKKLTNDEGFKYPSLYANYYDLNVFTIKGLKKIKPNYSVGVHLDYGIGQDWQYKSNSNYTGSNTVLITLSPTWQYHSAFSKEKGFDNRVKFFAEAAPSFGVATITLVKPLVETESDITLPDKRTDFIFGLQAAVGSEFFITNKLGAYLKCSMQCNHVSSKFYNDRYFAYALYEFGIFFRLKRDKMFYY